MKEKDLVEMCSEEKRLKSFKKWAFGNDVQCSKENMASAGFYCVGTKREPDLAKCYVCLKELDGWEEDDDPKTHHYKHCQFAELDKRESEMSVHEMLEMESFRQMNAASKVLDKKVEEFKQQRDLTRNVIENLI